MNRCFLSGHLTRSPELRLTPDGTAKVANFGLAVNERFSDRETGEQRETVHFFECSAWNRTAELAFEYLKKGSPVLIEGSLRFESWESDGQSRSRVTVRVQRFEFMSQRTDAEDTAPENAPVETPAQDTQPSGDETPPF